MVYIGSKFCHTDLTLLCVYAVCVYVQTRNACTIANVYSLHFTLIKISSNLVKLSLCVAIPIDFFSVNPH